MDEENLKERIKELVKKSCNIEKEINIEGMETIETMHKENYKMLKGKANGIYFVVCDINELQEVKSDTDGRKEYKGKTTIYDKENLVKRLENVKQQAKEKNEEWVILYIGKAERDNQKGLEERIEEYIKWRYEQTGSPHSGGRAIWQIQNNENFKFCWFEAENSSMIEEELHKEYKKEYGTLPFANQKIG